MGIKTLESSIIIVASLCFDCSLSTEHAFRLHSWPEKETDTQDKTGRCFLCLL